MAHIYEHVEELEFRYLKEFELQEIIGMEVCFQTPTLLHTGILKKEGKDYWLPYCGYVNALTIKILY